MMRRALVIGLTAFALTGCSQIDALAPVSGGPLTTVRVGVLDVLVREDVPILVAPVCTKEESQFSCIGSTVDGSEIIAAANLTAPYFMTVTVGDQVIYDGAVQDVLDEAARVTQ